MRRGNKITLYELMQPKQSPGEPRLPAERDAPARMLRVPVGFLYIGALVLLVLLVGFYAVGYQRGGASVRSDWERDRVDSARVDQNLQAIAEVDEPGGGTNEPPPSPEKVASTLPARLESPSTAEPAGLASVAESDPRRPGWNYYVLAHPSPSKALEMVAFCRQHGLAAYCVQRAKGDPKVIVTPGFEPGGSGAPEMVALRQRIREVGILWERLDPRQNRDFSTRFAEKHQPASGGG